MPKLDLQLDMGANFYDPLEFVEAVVYAEGLGFKTVWLADHFAPWFHSGKKSAFVWSQLGVALERTDKIRLGPLVTSPIGARYHPALIAQASATLDNMFPRRLLLGVGTGEALNETPFWRGRWPKWEERMERLTEGITLIRRLWDSKEPFSFHGKYFSSDYYFLYTKAKSKIPIYFSAIGKRAAYYAGVYGDSLVTQSPRNNKEKLEEEILPAYRQGRKDARKQDAHRLSIFVDFSFENPKEVIRSSWRTLASSLRKSWNLKNPIVAEAKGREVTAEDLRRCMHFCKDWDGLIESIDEYKQIGADAIVLFSGAEKKLIRKYAENVLNVL